MLANSQISMWGKYSSISSVKPTKGTRFKNRLDVFTEIENNSCVPAMVISLACDLLPFFNPSKEIAIISRLDRPEAYWKTLQREPVFKALCYFLQSHHRFTAVPSLQVGMLQMANDFISAKNGLFQVRHDSDITTVLRALRSCQPVGLTKFAAASVARTR